MMNYFRMFLLVLLVSNFIHREAAALQPCRYVAPNACSNSGPLTALPTGGCDAPSTCVCVLTSSPLPQVTPACVPACPGGVSTDIFGNCPYVPPTSFTMPLDSVPIQLKISQIYSVTKSHLPYDDFTMKVLGTFEVGTYDNSGVKTYPASGKSVFTVTFDLATGLQNPTQAQAKLFSDSCFDMTLQALSLFKLTSNAEFHIGTPCGSRNCIGSVSSVAKGFYTTDTSGNLTNVKLHSFTTTTSGLSASCTLLTP